MFFEKSLHIYRKIGTLADFVQKSLHIYRKKTHKVKINFQYWFIIANINELIQLVWCQWFYPYKKEITGSNPIAPTK